jgi:hypothetical protein
METYRGFLTKAFSEGILNALEDDTAQCPPGEFHFRSDFKRSKVLEGFHGPYKELSYYNVRWWRSSEQQLYTTAPLGKGGYGANGDSIFVRVSHSLTVSVGASEEYSEPSTDQVAKYQVAVAQTMKEAAEKTANEFKGLHSSTGYIIDMESISSDK